MAATTAEEIARLVHEELDNVEVDDREPDAAPIRVILQDAGIERSPCS